MDEQGWLQAAVERMRKHIGKVLWGVAGLAALYILWSIAGCKGCAGSISLWVAAAVLSLVVAGHFVNAFTRNLPSSKEDKELGRELRMIFIYGYVFQGLALVTGLILLIAPGPPWHEDKLQGLVYACQESETGSDLIRCANGNQWLLQIGGRPEGPFETQAEVELLDAVDSACNSEDAKLTISIELANFDTLFTEVADNIVAACEEADANRRKRIKEALLENGVVLRHSKLRGGLIVPLYVVVLSVMGAAVGMSRRLPEIQKQAAHSVQSSGKGISAIVARERVVFQIMQVLAAPLIAVTAFAAFEPGTVTAAVLIGFTSGFASEAVLMKLRQASEALTRKRSETQ